jgi:tetratricopeptide (TPR) repeat protein
MRATFRVTLAASCIIPALVCAYGVPQQSDNSFSEENLLELIRMEVSPSFIVNLVQKFGISFQPDEPTLERLKKQGAPEVVLEAIRAAAPPPQPKAPALPPPQPKAPALPPPQPKAPATAPQEERAKMSEATRHLGLSQLKAQNKDFDGALTALAEAEKLRPQWGEVFYQRGLVFAELHRYAEAVNEWKKYLAVAGAKADVKTVQDKIAEWEYQAGKGEKIRQLKDEGARSLKDFNAEGAIAAFQELVKAQPSLENLLPLAEAFWMKRDYESLSKTTAQALALDQNSPQAILYQGAVELGQGKTGKALSTIQRGISLDPKSAFGYELNCDALRLRGDSKGAWVQCERALQINPNSGFSHNRLGWILWNWQDYPKALEEFRKAVQVEPENAYWQSDLACALVDRGDLPGALVAAGEALRLDAKCPYSHHAIGMVLQAQGKVDQAILEFNEAIRLSPECQAEILEHLNSAGRKGKSVQ